MLRECSRDERTMTLVRNAGTQGREEKESE